MLLLETPGPCAQMLVKTEADYLEVDESGLSTSLVDMVGPDLARQFQKDMFSDQAARVFMARQRQKEIAQQHRGAHRPLVGGMRHVLEVDLEAYLEWDGQERGCWGDRGFLREFARDNDACRIQQQGVGASNRVAWTPEVESKPAEIPHILVTDKRGTITDVYVSQETIAKHVRAETEEPLTMLEQIAMERRDEA